MRGLFRRMCVAALVAAIGCVSVPSAPAQSSQSGNLDFTGDKVAVIVGAVVVVAAVVILVAVHKRSETATGCVRSGPGGTVLTRDADQRMYVLGGDTSTLQQGHRMTLRLKKTRPEGGKGAPVWLVRRSADAGLCAP